VPGAAQERAKGQQQSGGIFGWLADKVGAVSDRGGSDVAETETEHTHKTETRARKPYARYAGRLSAPSSSVSLP
jgi:hypothetical protein